MLKKLIPWIVGGGAVALLIFWWSITRISIPQAEQQKPVDTILPSDWQLGNSQGLLRVIEYSDFQCPACKFYSGTHEQIVSLYGDRVGFVYRHFPLREIHANANLAAQAAEAAGKQGKFWEMGSKLFAEQERWAESNKARDFFATYAQEIGLDVPRFRADMNSKEVKALVEADYLSGLVAKVNATPTFYINGQKMNNLRGPEDLIARIELALQQATESAAPTP